MPARGALDVRISTASDAIELAPLVDRAIIVASGELAAGPRMTVMVATLGLHVTIVWALLQMGTIVRDVAEVPAIDVVFVAAEVPVAAPPAPSEAEPAAPALEAAVEPPSPEPPVPVFSAEKSPPPPPPKVQPVPARPTVAPAPPRAPAKMQSDRPSDQPVQAVAPLAPAAPRLVPVSQVAYLVPPSPAYPSLARRDGVSGTVVVRALVDTNGRPAEVVLHASSGHAALDSSAMSAVHAARFRPYTENGVAEPVWVLIPIRFSMR